MDRTVADALRDLADLMRTRRIEAEAVCDRALEAAYRNREDAYRHAASIAECWEPEPVVGWPSDWSETELAQAAGR